MRDVSLKNLVRPYVERAVRALPRTVVEPAHQALALGLKSASDRAIEEAIAAHQRGALQRAWTLYARAAALERGAVRGLIGRSMIEYQLQDLDAARRTLDEAGRLAPWTQDLAPQRERLELVARRRSDLEAQEEVRALRAGLQGLEGELAGKELYQPSRFWSHFCALHVHLLVEYGFRRFKRTVSHNYQNWIMHDVVDDPLARNVSSKWLGLGLERVDPVTFSVPEHAGFHHSQLWPVYPLSDPNLMARYAHLVGMLWSYVVRQPGAERLVDMEESPIGGPLAVNLGGRPISSDLAHSILEVRRILATLELNGREGLTVLELGAGHGRLAEMFGRLTNFRYVILDIPPALLVAQEYVRRLFPGEKIFGFRPFADFSEVRREFDEARFAFFSANQIERLPRPCGDVFINMNSLMEMRLEQVENYLAHIKLVTSRAFVSRQWNQWRNAWDDVHVSKGTFSLDEWELAVDADDEMHPQLFFQVWRRP